MASGFRLALLQLKTLKNKTETLSRTTEWIRKAKAKGAEVVVLPECFNCPYGSEYFKEYAETIPEGPTSAMLSSAAKENSIYLVGGTIPEKDNGNLIYNTSTVWNPEGKLILKYRKMHLFDIDIPGKITFKESDVLSPGSDLGIFTVGNCKIGMGICYDLRFEELARLYRNEGCKMIIYPGAFNMTTGKIHWELLQCGRAVDNQLYVAAVSPARDTTASYVAWGHSQITDPWGKVLVTANESEDMIFADIDLNECDTVRQQIPIFKQRRTDVYNTIQINKK